MLFLKALKCEPTPRPPIWLMRQAGRYMPQYRALRAKYSFRELVGTPELAAQITRLPIELLGVDAAILFSDILVLAEVFGYQIDFKEGKGIQLVSPEKEMERDVVETLNYVAGAIQLLKQDLTVPLIGFCGGPYTVAKYMKTVTREWLHRITQATIAYLQMQIEAGVDAVQIFDSWAGMLEPQEFQDLALPYLRMIVEALRPTGIPVIVFCRGSARYLHELVGLEPACLGFDWEKPMLQLRSEVPSHLAVQGNLDPTILKGPLPVLQSEVEALLESMQGARGFIFNLGHGVQPETPLENVQWLVSRVKSINKN